MLKLTLALIAFIRMADCCMSGNRQTATVDETPLGDWSDWSECNNHCGIGEQWRWRPLLIAGLSEKINRSRSCARVDGCPASHIWGSWSAWSSCSVSCGEGKQKRTRICSPIVSSTLLAVNGTCDGSGVETRNCRGVGTDGCPSLYAWSTWTTWSKCSRTCGGDGFHKRTRQCHDDNSAVVDPTGHCKGETDQTRQCNNEKVCPPTYAWGTWSPWSSCSVTCGKGKRQRTRSCEIFSSGSNKSSTESDACEGVSIERRDCEPGDCPPSYEWSDWSSWSDCSKTCGSGIASRLRECREGSTGVVFTAGHCDGNASDTRECVVQKWCPYYPEWSLWSTWSSCSATCGQGQKSRSRTRVCLINNTSTTQRCQQIQPSSASESASCQIVACQPVNGGWSSWADWSICLATCGTGRKTRLRYCDNPKPQHGGANCSGLSMEIAKCNGGDCAVDGMWGAWESCSECRTQPTNQCKAGTERICRNCDSPPPENGGKVCDGGTSAEWRDCWNVNACDTEAAQAPMEFKIVGFYNTTDLRAEWRRTPYGLAAESFLLNWGTNAENAIEKIVPVSDNKNALGEKYSLWIRGYSRGTEVMVAIITRCRKDGTIRSSNLLKESFKVGRVDGGWGPWGSWGPCGTTNCRVPGKYTRTRVCNNPRPTADGKDCDGSDKEDHICVISC